jgi:hypothetical protein
MSKADGPGDKEQVKQSALARQEESSARLAIPKQRHGYLNLT